MTSREVLIAIVSTVVGGVIIWIIQQYYLNRRENRKSKAQRIVRPPNDERLITNDIFRNLCPGSSTAFMKELLGAPNKFSRVDSPVFVEITYEPSKTNSYLYLFGNANIKIASKDDEIIDSLTVISEDKSLTLHDLAIQTSQNNLSLGELKVDRSLLEIIDHSEMITTRFDSSFAIEYNTAAPLHQCYTLFGFSNKYMEFAENHDPAVFLGAVINGICISYSVEESYFIHEYELT